MRGARSLVIAVAAVTFLSVSAPSARAADGSWEFHLAPYLWGAGLDGTVGVAGQTADVDLSFSDLVEFADIGGSLHFEAWARPWGWFGDAMYVKLEDETTGPAGGTIRAEMEQTFAEAGGTYEFADKVEVLFGLRYQKADNDIAFPSPVGAVSAGRGWVDAFGGVRWTPIRTERWLFSVRGDIGAGESDLVWLAAVGGGFRFNKTVALLAGYRHLDTDFEDDGFTWDVAQGGFGLGVDFAW